MLVNVMEIPLMEVILQTREIAHATVCSVHLNT